MRSPSRTHLATEVTRAEKEKTDIRAFDSDRKANEDEDGIKTCEKDGIAGGRER